MSVGCGGEGYKNVKSSSRMLEGSENVAGSFGLEVISVGNAVLLVLRLMLWIRNRTPSDERIDMSASAALTLGFVNAGGRKRSEDMRTIGMDLCVV